MGCPNLFRGEDKNRLLSVSFSPTGTLLASGTSDGKVQIFDIESTEPLKHELEGHSQQVFSVCWSHDGSKVASGSVDESMKIWDASTGECLHTIKVELGQICHVAWSADGSRIASSTYSWIRIYNAQTYKLLIEFKPGDSSWQLIDFSPKGDRLVYGSGKSVFIRDLTRNTVVSRFDGQYSTSVRYSPSGTSVISAGSTLVRIWALNSERAAPGHEPDTFKPFHTVLFSSNGQLLATNTDEEQEIRLFDATTYSHIDTLYLDEEQARHWSHHLAFSSDSTLIACGCPFWIRIWNMDKRD
jgi:WD40 repeat protein